MAILPKFLFQTQLLLLAFRDFALENASLLPHQRPMCFLCSAFACSPSAPLPSPCSIPHAYAPVQTSPVSKIGFKCYLFICSSPSPLYSFPVAVVTNYYKLKTSEIYFLTVLEARSLKSKTQQSWTPSRRSREDSIPCLIQLLVGVNIPCLLAYISQAFPEKQNQ